MNLLWLIALLLATPSAAFAQGAPCPVHAHSAMVVTGTTDTIGGQDLCRTKVYTSGSAVSITLPYVTTLGGYNFWVRLFMEGAGAGTVTPSAPPVSGSAPTINGGSTLSITAGHSATIWFGTDGNWYATYQGG